MNFVACGSRRRIPAASAFLVVQNHAVQIDERLRIDENANVVELKDPITFTRLRVKSGRYSLDRNSRRPVRPDAAALVRRDAFLSHRAAHLAQAYR